MATIKRKSFSFSDSRQLAKVDAWWANLLRTGPKEICGVEWEAYGDLRWKMTLLWAKVDADIELNVGMPAFAGYPNNELEDYLLDQLGEYESASSDLRQFEERLMLLGAHEAITDKGERYVTVSEGVSYLDEMIVTDFLWPTYLSCKRYVAKCETGMAELRAELVARQSPDFIHVSVDRGMLQQSFEESFGYDATWLFDTHEFSDVPDPDDC